MVLMGLPLVAFPLFCISVVIGVIAATAEEKLQTWERKALYTLAIGGILVFLSLFILG